MTTPSGSDLDTTKREPRDAVAATYVAILVALGLAGALSTGRLVEAAERLPFGPARETAVTLAVEAHTLATRAGLHRPSAAVDAARAAAERAEPVVAAEIGDVADRIGNAVSRILSLAGTGAPTLIARSLGAEIDSNGAGAFGDAGRASERDRAGGEGSTATAEDRDDGADSGAGSGQSLGQDSAEDSGTGSGEGSGSDRSGDGRSDEGAREGGGLDLSGETATALDPTAGSGDAEATASGHGADLGSGTDLDIGWGDGAGDGTAAEMGGGREDGAGDTIDSAARRRSTLAAAEAGADGDWTPWPGGPEGAPGPGRITREIRRIATRVPAPRRLDPTDPLRVHVAGDSMAQPLGYALQRLVVDDPRVVVTLDFRISTGLVRSDYFDWPERLASTVDAREGPPNLPAPEVVVFFVGGNENQNMRVGIQTVLLRGTPEWAEAYGERAAEVMDIAGRGGARVVWVGMPVVRDPDFNAAAQRMNAAVSAAAENRPWVTFVDIWSMFAGPDGGFAPFLPGADGAPVQMRDEDGVHLSEDGTRRVGAAVFRSIGGVWDVRTPTPTSTSTSTPTATSTRTPTHTRTPTMIATATSQATSTVSPGPERTHVPSTTPRPLASALLEGAATAVPAQAPWGTERVILGAMMVGNWEADSPRPTMDDPKPGESEIIAAAREVLRWIEPSAEPKIEAACVVRQSEVIAFGIGLSEPTRDEYRDWFSGAVEPVPQLKGDPWVVVVVASRKDLGQIVGQYLYSKSDDIWSDVVKGTFPEGSSDQQNVRAVFESGTGRRLASAGEFGPRAATAIERCRATGIKIGRQVEAAPTVPSVRVEGATSPMPPQAKKLTRPIGSRAELSRTAREAMDRYPHDVGTRWTYRLTWLRADVSWMSWTITETVEELCLAENDSLVARVSVVARSDNAASAGEIDALLENEGARGQLFHIVSPLSNRLRILSNRGVFAMPSDTESGDTFEVLLARGGWPSPLRVPRTNTLIDFGASIGDWLYPGNVHVRATDARVETVLGPLDGCWILSEQGGAGFGYYRWFCSGVGIVRSEYFSAYAMHFDKAVSELVDFHRPQQLSEVSR